MSICSSCLTLLDTPGTLVEIVLLEDSGRSLGSGCFSWIEFVIGWNKLWLLGDNGRFGNLLVLLWRL